MPILRNIFSHSFAKVREINAKYAAPSIEMSGWVKFALLSLRLYLLSLIGLLIYKFITMVG